MKLNVAVCDDEKIISNEIKNRLHNMYPDHLIDIYDSGSDLLKAKKIYDLIFLDIEMPEVNGMETAEQLRKKGNGEYIIFLTSHTEFVSSKKENGHGYGVKNIKECLEKYNSCMDYRYENGMFITDIVIPNVLEL